MSYLLGDLLGEFETRLDEVPRLLNGDLSGERARLVLLLDSARLTALPGGAVSSTVGRVSRSAPARPILTAGTGAVFATFCSFGGERKRRPKKKRRRGLTSLLGGGTPAAKAAASAARMAVTRARSRSRIK